MAWLLKIHLSDQRSHSFYLDFHSLQYSVKLEKGDYVLKLQVRWHESWNYMRVRKITQVLLSRASLSRVFSEIVRFRLHWLSLNLQVAFVKRELGGGCLSTDLGEGLRRIMGEDRSPLNFWTKTKACGAETLSCFVLPRETRRTTKLCSFFQGFHSPPPLPFPFIVIWIYHRYPSRWRKTKQKKQKKNTEFR